MALTSTFILLLLAEVSHFPKSCEFEAVYCVVSMRNDSRQCDSTVQCKTAKECDTLDYFTQNASRYLQPHSRFLFLPGYHEHRRKVIVNGINDMKFSGLTEDSRQSVIDCTVKNVGFLFHNFSRIVFENLTITNCGQIFVPHYSENSDKKITRSAALAFDIGATLTLNNLNVTNPQSQGFYINQVEREISILYSMFQHASSRGQKGEKIVAGNSIFSADCSLPMPMAYIYKSHFINNSNIDDSYLPTVSNGQRKCSRFASGLLIVLKCTNFAVTLDEVTFDGNKGCEGGNLIIIFFNISKPFTASLAISNSLFQNGYAAFGGGILVSLVEAVNFKNLTGFQLKQCGYNETELRDILKITNTSFINNTAHGFGGGISLRLKNSLTSCADSLKISINNCTFRGNSISQSGYGGVAVHIVNYLTFQYIRQLLPQFELSITDSIFYENRAVNKYTGSGSGVISVKDGNHVNISNVEIYDNTDCSGLLAIGSILVFTGKINIHHNNASSGGGILLCSNAIMYLQPYAQLIITNNRAYHTGGGICVEERCLVSLPECFYQLGFDATIELSLISSINITLADNAAEYAGHQLFGGSVDYCYLIDPPYHNRTTNSSKEVYDEVFHISPNVSSAVTSPERQVCMCRETSVDCSLSRNLTMPPVYPGEMFQIQAVLVGQLNGILPGTVLAKLIDETDDQCLNHTNYAQNINSLYCSNLSYTIMTTKLSNEATLKLEAEFDGDASFADRLDLFTPLFLTVPFKSCPVGFSLSNRGKCECLPILLPSVHCEIQSNSLSLTKDNWIGYDQSSNRILYSYGYSLDYCYPNATVVNINDSHSQNAQCRHKRRGILCGKCQEDHSVVLGSSQCRNDCKQYHLLLIPVFGLAGLILVVILIVLNMTVTVGTLNGLIFYANLVQLSNTQYFQDESKIPSSITSVLKVFIAWLNLDLGIETCLYKGMDDYTKAWLQFIFPLYIWLILALIVYLSRRYSFASTLIGNNGVKVLATLVLLSYSKMLRAAIATAHMKFIYHIPVDGSYNHRHLCWIFDCNIPGFRGKHVPLFIAGLIVSLVLLPFTFVLLFIRHLNKISDWPFFCWVWRLKPLFDAYTGPFTNEARCWTGVLCFVRLVLFITSTVSSSGLVNLTVGLSNIATICLLFFGWLTRTRIYKKKWLHILESSFMLNLGALSMGTLFLRYGGYIKSCNALTHLLVGMAFIMFLGIIGYHIRTQLNDNVTKFFQCSKFVKRMIARICRSKAENTVCDESATSDEGIDELFQNIDSERRHLLPKVS